MMLGMLRRHRAGVALCALLAVGTALTACGGEGSSGSAPASGSAAPAITIEAAEFPWSASKITNAILTEVAAQHPELGVAEIRTTALGPAPAWAGAQRGDLDLLAEVALPNQQELADQAKDRVRLVHQTYGDAQQGWFVPTYATQPGQPLAGLTSVDQLNQYADALGNELVDADPSFITTQQNAKRLQGYGLTLRQVSSSEAAQLAELRRAYERQEPILVYLYRPHWVFNEFQMTQLQEPTPNTPECLTTGNGACAMPAYSAWTAASTKVEQEAPRFHAVLQRFEVPLADMETMLKSVDIDKKEADAVAKEWLGANQQRVQQWLATA